MGKFKIGDQVRTTGTGGAPETWVGLVGTVVQVANRPGGGVLLKPFTERPDGRGLTGFYWPEDLLELVREDSLAERARALAQEMEREAGAIESDLRLVASGLRNVADRIDKIGRVGS